MTATKEKSRSSAATPERDKLGANNQPDHSTQAHSTSLSVNRQSVASILPTGKENAIPGHSIMAVLGLTDLRDLTQLVERERRDGCAICASTGGEKGYYLAADAEELSAYLKSLCRRVHNIHRTMTHLEDTLNRMTGQTKIGG